MKFLNRIDPAKTQFYAGSIKIILFDLWFSKKILIILIMFFLSNCTKDDLFDFYIGPQPKFINEEPFDKQLNIFGVLRPDSSSQFPNNYIIDQNGQLTGQSMSYINVERTIMSINDTISDTIPIPSAKVNLYKIENSKVQDTIKLYFTNFNGHFNKMRYRAKGFYPKPGEMYMLSCFKEGYDTVFSQTIIPDPPELTNAVNVKNKSLNFTLKNNKSIHLYDVYIISGLDSYFERIVPENEEEIEVFIDFDFDLSSSSYILIYGYDENLANYFAFPNVFIKPNTYRPPFTTVEGGYGCFGSLNYTCVILN